MSRAARSVGVFAVYLYVLGAVLVVAPNSLLSLFRIPITSESWIRVVGLLVLILGVYYSTAARNDLTPMIRTTVYGRFAVLAGLAVFVWLDLFPPMLLVFGIIDVLAAIWTALALRTDRVTLS